jgi:hypothetical protein
MASKPVLKGTKRFFTAEVEAIYYSNYKNNFEKVFSTN